MGFEGGRSNVILVNKLWFWKLISEWKKGVRWELV